MPELSPNGPCASRVCLGCRYAHAAPGKPFCWRCWRRVSRGAQARLYTAYRRGGVSDPDYRAALARCQEEARTPSPTEKGA